MTNENDDMRQLAAVEQLPPNLMLLKMENESIMTVARAHPRDPLKVITDLKALIAAYPAAADGAIYSKPVGSVQEVTCGAAKCGVRYETPKVDANTVCPACGSPEKANQRRKKKFAEGLSIRAAESIRSVFGYTRLATTCDVLPSGDAKITGILVDYAAGNVTSDERVVSRMYKDYQGKMVQTPMDRFINVVVKAEKSKLRRDVILDSTPGIVKAAFRDECERLMHDLIAPETIQQKILPAFAEYGLGVEQLDQILGRSSAMGWREKDRMELLKILSALKNEETTVQDLLEQPERSSPQTATAGPVTGSALTAGEAIAEPEPDETKDKAPKDKAPKDKAPKDKAPKDKAPKDKAPKDKAPKSPKPSSGSREEITSQFDAATDAAGVNAIYENWNGQLEQADKDWLFEEAERRLLAMKKSGTKATQKTLVN